MEEWTTFKLSSSPAVDIWPLNSRGTQIFACAKLASDLQGLKLKACYHQKDLSQFTFSQLLASLKPALIVIGYLNDLIQPTNIITKRWDEHQSSSQLGGERLRQSWHRLNFGLA